MVLILSKKLLYRTKTTQYTLHQNIKIIRYFSKKKGVIHQDYYHPQDVPFYQTPPLGDPDMAKKPVSIEDFVSPMSNLNLRFDAAKKHYVNPDKDNPTHVMSQNPELFLPEEPTFLEFWGFYPFVLFAGATYISKEFFLLFNSGHSSILLAPGVIALLVVLLQLINKYLLENNQFFIDRYWCKLTGFAKNLQKCIKFYEGHVKTKERTEKFDLYLKALTHYKVASFAHKRQKTLAKEMLNRLTKIKESEEMLIKVMNKKEEKENDSLLSLIEKDENIKKEWNEKVMKLLNKHSEENRNWKPDLKMKIENIEKSEKKNKVNYAFNSSFRGYLQTIYGTLNALNVYKGPRDIPKDLTPEKMNIKGELTDQQKSKFFSKDKIVKSQLIWLKRQSMRFKKGKVPVQLTEMIKKTEEKLSK